MVVAVQRPERKRDPLEIIAQGLQVAGGILGIKESFERSDLRELQTKREQTQFDLAQEELTRKKEGRLSPEEFANIRTKYTPVEEGTPGAFGGFSYEGKPQFLKPTSEITTERQLEAAKTAAEKEAAKARQKREDDLRKEFDARIEKPNGPLAQLRKSRQIVDIYNKDSTLSTADDVAAINLFARILSPGIVTTTDYENVRAIGGYPEKAKGFIDRIRGQGELTPIQRAELVNSVKSLSQGPINEFNSFAEAYKRLATQDEVDVNDVVAPEKIDFIGTLESKIESAFQKLNSGKTAGNQPQQFSLGQTIERGGIKYRYIGNDQWEVIE